MSDDQPKRSLFGSLLKVIGGKKSQSADAPEEVAAAEDIPAEEALSEEDAVLADAAETEEAAADPVSEQHFTIRLAVGEEALERVRDLLLEDERITGVGVEMAPPPAVADEGAEPERNVLRINCMVADLGAFMEEIHALLRRRLRAVDYHTMSIDRY